MSDIIAKPVAGSNFHITLSFLGQVSDKILEKILDSLISIPVPSFEVSLGPLIYWPKPQVLALSLSKPLLQLVSCKKYIEQQVAETGYFQFDKKTYTPHITLFRQVEKTSKENSTLDATIQVNEISLMASIQSKNGVFYETIETWPLTPPNIKKQLLGI